MMILEMHYSIEFEDSIDYIDSICRNWCLRCFVCFL